MTVLSKFIGNLKKLEQEQQQRQGFDNPFLQTDHYVTDHRSIFISSSIFSLMTWIFSLVHQFNSNRNLNKEIHSQTSEISKSYEKKKSRKFESSSLINTFIKLIKILRKCLSPNDFIYAIGIILALALRTMCDLWVIHNGTQIEASIINSDYKRIKLNILEFLYAAPILALVNNGLKYCINRLQLNIRYKISSYLTDNYIKGLTYYRINALDNKFKNIDQLLTNDVDKLSHTMVDIYSNVVKPLLDIVIYIRKLSATYTGITTPAVMISYLIVAGAMLTNARRSLAGMTIQESLLEGELRFVHSRIISNCEEIAFYKGNKRENVTLKSALDRLKEHLKNVMLFKFNFDYLDNMMIKYFGMMCGYLALSMPFLSNRYVSDNQTQKQLTYYKSGRILLNLSAAIARLVTAGRDLNRLTAYVNQVSELVDYMNQEHDSLQNTMKSTKSRFGRMLIPFSGSVEYCNVANPVIQMVDVPLCTPSGDILVDSMNFKISIGQNVIITGPNGSGKSSLFRLLGELWPLYGGKLIKPKNDRLFYIPQKPYMALGTFRDQIIYPDTIEDLQSKMITDDDLQEILKIVQLEYLLERESFDSVQDWQEVLSGGEKQRLAIARLIYQKPQFAILDECTSAVSVDVEQSIYKYLCDQKFCSLLSVTHRLKQLQKFHDYILEFDGAGSCTFKIILDEN